MRPRKKAGSRRSQSARPSYGVGPDGLPVGLYLVELVFACRFDDTELGRAKRYTAQGFECIDGQTETSTVPDGSGELPRQVEDGFAKWRFVCSTCGHNVPLADHRVEALLDEIDDPWARRARRIHV